MAERAWPWVELRFDLIDAVAWNGQQADPAAISHEGRRILEMRQVPVIVADLASATALPLVVIPVLLGDLVVHDGPARRARRHPEGLGHRPAPASPGAGRHQDTIDKGLAIAGALPSH
jgi:Protein of unknown function (DUF742)